MYRPAPGDELDADEVVLRIAEENDREDPWEGPVPDRVLRYRRYRCALLPVAAIDLDGHGHDPVLAREYSRAPAEGFPPVVYDPLDRMLVDGYHRTHAAILRGETNILALVGIETTAVIGWTDS